MIRFAIFCLLATSLHAAQQPATVDLKVDKAHLLALLERVAKQCDAGLVVHTGLDDIVSQEIHLIARDVKWDDAMALFAGYGLSVTLTGGYLEVVGADAALASRVELRFYDVRAINAGTTTFPGPDLDIPEPGGSGSRLLPAIEDAAPPDLNETIDIIRHQIAPESWQRDHVSIEEFRGSIAVTHVPEVQEKIAALLKELELTKSRQVVCRIYSFEQAQIPADSGTIIAAETWKSLAATLKPTAAVVVRDGQQNYIFSGIQSAYIADEDIVQERQDPIVTIWSKGLKLDVEPAVTIGGVLATIRFTANVDNEMTSATISDDQGTTTTTIELPKGVFDTARDTRLVPFGAAALYRFGNRAYAIEFVVLDSAKSH